MRTILLAALAVTALVGNRCAAQGDARNKPISLAAVSCAGYDRLIADVNAVGQWCGDESLGQRLQMLLLTLPQGDASKGPLALDTARPWGAVRLVGGPSPVSYLFLPVAEIRPLMDLIEGQLGCTAKVKNGVYQIPFGKEAFYASHNRHWAFIADSPQALEKVAANPETLLGDLPQRYDLAIHASPDAIPEEYRQALPSWSCLDEMDDLLLGWNVDSQTKTSYVDLELRARLGTNLAVDLAQVTPGKSDFFELAMPNAAVTAVAAGVLSDTRAGQLNGLLAILHVYTLVQLQSQGLSNAAFQSASRLLNALASALQKAVVRKKLDGGLAIRLDAVGGTLLAGASLANAGRLEAALQRATEEIPRNDPLAKTITMAGETYHGIRLHTISLALPDRQWTPLVGDRLEAAVGIADDKVLIAAGRDALPTLKSALDRLKTAGAKEVPPLKITVAVAPVARLLATVAQDPGLKANAALLAGLFSNSNDKGCDTLSVQRIPRGVRLRLRVDDKVLRGLIALAQTLGTYLPR